MKQCLITYGVFDYCKVNMTDYRIKLPNDAELIFKGMDNPEKIKSMKLLMWSWKRLQNSRLMILPQLTLRLRDKGHKQKQIYLMFNPVSKTNSVFKYFFEKKPANTVIYQTTYKSNRFLDELTKQNIEELANRNPAYYKIYALGEFCYSRQAKLFQPIKNG